MPQPTDPELAFDPGDFDILDMALRRNAELFLGAWAVKRRRELQLAYPLLDHKSLTKLIDHEEFVGRGYGILPEDIARYMPLEFFPIDSDEALIDRVRIALLRARQESAFRKFRELSIPIPVEPGEI
jgi:hypothetical protein